MKDYYNGTEVWGLIEDMELNFNRGNVIKYVCRAGRKDASKELEDLHKALDYLKREIVRVSMENEDERR